MNTNTPIINARSSNVLKYKYVLIILSGESRVWANNESVNHDRSEFVAAILFEVGALPIIVVIGP